MRRLQIDETGPLRAALSLAVRQSAQSRFVHRLDCVGLVGAGLSCYTVAGVFGEHPRTIERWVKRFQACGVEGLLERPRTGRRATLDADQMATLEATLGRSPFCCGYRSALWDARTLQHEIRSRFDVALGRRQCQRLLRVLHPPTAVRTAGAADAAGLPSGPIAALSRHRTTGGRM